MDERRQTAVETRRETSSALPFAEQREQVRRFLGELSESTAAAEAEIAGIVKQLLDDVAAVPRGGSGSKETAAREAQIAAREAQFASLETQLTAREAQLVARQAELTEQLKRLEAERNAWEAAAAQGAQRDSASGAALEALKHERKQLADERSRLEHETEETNRLRARLEERRLRHEQAEEELEAEKRKAKSRRRKMLAEIAEQSEQAEAALKRREIELQAKAEALAARERSLAERPNVDTSGLESEVRRLQRELDEYVESYEECRRENLELRERLESVQASVGDGGDDELRHRFEETQAELRELQRRHLELERAHEAALSAPQAGAGAGGPLPMDWESQKRRLLASLESDTTMNEPKSRSDKLTVEGTIRITDGVVQEKEREIAELKQMLEQQSRNVGEVSIGAAALAGMLDQDDLIREHREQAETLKKQWEEKLRAAEIEISIERAKIGRERNELAEKQAELEAQLNQKGQEPLAVIAPNADPKRTGGGRWLARLGLRDNEKG
jgi:DNA repair exonuclease SbcCD ATPase subunit